MVNLAILGAGGRMGGALERLIEAREDCQIVAGVDARAENLQLPYPVFADVGALLAAEVKPDALIDFSHPDATRAALPLCAAAGLPVVVCTTGLDEETKALVQEAAGKTAVFYSANMSLGVNLLVALARRAAAALPGFDIEIIEKHHRTKLDAPSGTALLLADEINDEMDGRYHYQYNRQPLRQKRPDDEIGIHAVRGGSIVGEHEVLFAGPDEVVTLSHAAHSRDVFANGAINAAVYLCGKAPGLYSMADLID